MYVRIIVFFLFFILFMKSLLSPFSVLCGSFFIRTRIVRESYDLPGTYIRACRRASYQISTTYRAVNTAKHSAVNPHKQQSKHAPIRARQCKQADRVGSSQHVVEYLYSSLCSQNKRRNRNLPRGLQKCTTCLLYTSPSPRD